MGTVPTKIEGGNCPQCERPIAGDATNATTWWWCPRCLIGTRDFGFMTLKEAREYALRRRQAEAKTLPKASSMRTRRKI